MNEFKGTKGKWEVVSSEEYSDTIYLKNEYGAPSFKENEANALLVSKAPEMLEILKELLKWNAHFPTAMDDIIIKAREVIYESTNI